MIDSFLREYKGLDAEKEQIVSQKKQEIENMLQSETEKNKIKKEVTEAYNDLQNKLISANDSLVKYRNIKIHKIKTNRKKQNQKRKSIYICVVSNLSDRIYVRQHITKKIPAKAVKRKKLSKKL